MCEALAALAICADPQSCSCQSAGDSDATPKSGQSAVRWRSHCKIMKALPIFCTMSSPERVALQDDVNFRARPIGADSMFDAVQRVGVHVPSIVVAPAGYESLPDLLGKFFLEPTGWSAMTSALSCAELRGRDVFRRARYTKLGERLLLGKGIKKLAGLAT